MAHTIKTLSRALTPAPATLPSLGTISDAEIDQVIAYAENEKALTSRRAYAADWRQFSLWCAARAIVPLGCGPGPWQRICPGSPARAEGQHHRAQGGVDRPSPQDRRP